MVYNLAADMGGMGFIELNKAACMLSVLINTHLLVAAQDAGVSRFFFASSACVYCVRGTRMIMDSDFAEPINLGSGELCRSTNWSTSLKRSPGPHSREAITCWLRKGVNGRNSDNTLIQKIFRGEPSTRLRAGLEHTYRWIYDQIKQRKPALNAA